MNLENYFSIKKKLPEEVKLIAISKTKPVKDILTLYETGQRVFGENKALEIQEKYNVLPKDIEWHFIGHLQTNKIKYIAPYISLIHSIDSFRLLQEVNKHGEKNQRVIPCLLQFHIASEENKFGLSLEECIEMLENPSFQSLKNIEIQGVMGMATYTENNRQIRGEFQQLKSHFHFLKEHFFQTSVTFKEISMGMTDDYLIAIEEGSTMVRIGSAIFGERDNGK